MVVVVTKGLFGDGVRQFLYESLLWVRHLLLPGIHVHPAEQGHLSRCGRRSVATPVDSLID